MSAKPFTSADIKGLWPLDDMHPEDAARVRATVELVERLRATLEAVEWGRYGTECPACGASAPP